MAVISAPDTALVQVRPLASRANNFNFLRFVLAALVIFSHSFTLVGIRADPLEVATHGQAFIGGVAVAFFFAISGFLIVQSWLFSRSAGDYLKKRLLRIYPGYIAAALISVVIVGALGADSTREYLHQLHWGALVKSLVLLKFLPNPPTFPHLPNHDINGSLWSIPVEFLCYLLVALLGLSRCYRKRESVLLLFLFTMTLWAAQIHYGWVFMEGKVWRIGGAPNVWPRMFSFFLAGMCFYFYKDEIVFNRSGVVISVAALGLAGLTGCLALALVPFGTYLLFYCAFSPTIRMQDFGSKADLSYGVYLYAWPIQQLLVKYVLPVRNPLLLFACALPLSCLAASVSWFAVEQPFLRLKKGRRKETAQK